MEVPMSERCIHYINAETLKCTKCNAPFDLAAKDPRPFNVVKDEHRKAKEERYDMNENLKEDAQADEDYRNSRKP